MQTAKLLGIELLAVALILQNVLGFDKKAPWTLGSQIASANCAEIQPPVSASKQLSDPKPPISSDESNPTVDASFEIRHPPVEG